MASRFFRVLGSLLRGTVRDYVTLLQNLSKHTAGRVHFKTLFRFFCMF